MKIKTLLVCLVAMLFSLTSCNKENYKTDYLGDYTMTITPSITLSISTGQMQLPLDNINVTCCIREVDDKSNDVNIYMYEGSEQLFVFEGVCDENSLRMNALTIDKNAEINGFGEVSFNATIGATRIGKPVDGKLSWESVVAGNVGLNMIGMPDQASISGTMTFSGNKQ